MLTTEAEFKIGVWAVWNEIASAAVVIQKSSEMLILTVDLIWLFDYFLGRILNNIFLYIYVMWVGCFLPFLLVSLLKGTSFLVLGFTVDNESIRI